MHSLIINDKKISDFGIMIRSINRPILPERGYEEYKIQGRDGQRIEAGQYHNRIISIQLYYIEKTMEGMRQKTREFVSFLKEKNKLIFTDEPDKYYLGMLLEQADLEELGSVGETTLNFVCDPFAYAKNKTTLKLKVGHNRGIGYQGTANAPTRIVIRNTGTETIRNIKITQIRKGD